MTGDDERVKSRGDPEPRWIAGRYEVGARIGRGAHGDVHSARDRLTGETVAIKLMRDVGIARDARFRREIAALRMLRIPGVVRLLDEGVDRDIGFVVLDLVDGTPFPGRGTPRTWEAIEEVTLALLETLSRIHAAGVVHRDLKPANVLVTAERRPVVLDFGVSWGSLTPGLTAHGELLGTPAYIAPEQITGGPVTPRTDLYALGAMVYEFLAGRGPFESEFVLAVMHARLVRRPTPLRELCPDAPAFVADALDRMLSTRSEERPPTAGAAIALLRGDRGRLALTQRLALSPVERAIEAMITHARSRRAVDLVGPRGSGRSHCLDELSRRLADEGATALRTARGRAPFSGLAPILAGLDPDLDLDATRAQAEQRLRGALSTGATVLVDDAEQLDVWSSEIIARCLGAGCVVRAFTAARDDSGSAARVELRALTRDEMRACFHGPERLFQLQSGAAHALDARTGGAVASIIEELDAWGRAGLARWQDGRYVIDREAIDHLANGWRVAPITSRDASPTRALEAHQADALEWIALAQPDAGLDTLARAMERPRWQIDATLRELVDAGHARRHPDGRYEPVSHVPGEAGWSTQRRQRAHAALAQHLASGTEARLRHLLAAHSAEPFPSREVVAEATSAARAMNRSGRPGPAIDLLAETLLTLRRAAVDADGEAALLETWVVISLDDRTPRVLDRVAYELARSADTSPRIERLVGLVQAALARNTGGPRALDLVEAVPPFESLELERCRQALRVAAARRHPLAREESVVEEAVRWASAHDDAETRAQALGWRGRLLYRQGRYDESARLHLRAASECTSALGRVEHTIAAASAWLEDFALDEAQRCAREGLDEALRCRHPHHAARAEWILRQAAYRSGRAAEPDDELLDAVARLGLAEVDGLVSTTEAAVCWRVGRDDDARRLSARAFAAWKTADNPWAALVSRCIALASGATATDDDVLELATRASACPLPRAAAQALGLLGLAAPTQRTALQTMMEPIARRIPRAFWSRRFEVLSVEEALTYLAEGRAESRRDHA